MALTPFHALAFMFLYFRDKRKVDPLALAVSTTFIDLETLYYLLIGEPSKMFCENVINLIAA
ncbi:MAG: hypothetical protein ACPLZC_04700 [Candidatus Bathyarchaeales archaeon]